MKTEIDVKLIEEAIEMLSLIGSTSTFTARELLKQAIAPKPQFYKGQQGLASHNEVEWYPRILISIKDGKIVCRDGARGNPHQWAYFKPDPDAVTLPVWLPYTGMEDIPDTPVNRVVISDCKTVYTIIPPYEVLS